MKDVLHYLGYSRLEHKIVEWLGVVGVKEAGWV